MKKLSSYRLLERYEGIKAIGRNRAARAVVNPSGESMVELNDC